ncbi:hypothetical protein B7P43_G06542 [Cryptotermes secundus]|uniref:Uncharacterized protein n=1 Tax=Cryptotermes secundus TaxID=105785 RepID=A0A2J7RHH4_9NEOP|nr:hypothetical protein B7P43_G06542 [Cryptotermes secundus]
MVTVLFCLLLVSCVVAWNGDLSYWSYGRGYGRGHYGTPNYNYWDDIQNGNLQTYPCFYPWCAYRLNL